MKNIKFYLILLLVSFFVGFGSISAASKLFTCNYKIKMNSDGTTFPLEVNVYDNGTAEFINAGHKMSKRTMGKIYISAKETEPIETLDIDTNEYHKKAYNNGQYSCITLSMYSVQYGYWTLKNSDEGNSTGESYTSFVTKGGTPTVYSSTGDVIKNPDNVIKMTSSCSTLFFKSGSIKDTNVDFSVEFQMFSDNSKKFCVKMDNFEQSCELVDKTLTINYGNKYHYFEIPNDQVSKIFQQGNMAMINNNAFVCPEKVYLEQVQSTNNLTTSSATYYSITTELSKESNPSTELFDSPNGNNNDINNGVKQYGCDVIPKVVKTWIKNILNLVKYVGLVLVIILGTMDFIKAAASGEPDAMKKAGQAFIKRVIAVIILFLAQYLVDLILHLINLYGASSTCLPE